MFYYVNISSKYNYFGFNNFHKINFSKKILVKCIIELIDIQVNIKIGQ